ncbi:hypothetical protein [Planomonospora venezuelensis]|uniref:Uncharacterized protein n=1 Tax=Planomonospora venezuelensis TaxID=1999 RepID=A0A841CR07_PLAVE|nr:hypothetical protein [Planomonospora venezuelensis]MBB5960862.1 hypothetical protein [Planomonospora venezuelensis]
MREAALEAAETPMWQQAIGPDGQPVFHADGTPMMFPVPMEQKMAPVIRAAAEADDHAENVRAAVLFFMALVGGVVMTVQSWEKYLDSTDGSPGLAIFVSCGTCVVAVFFIAMVRAIFHRE